MALANCVLLVYLPSEGFRHISRFLRSASGLSTQAPTVRCTSEYPDAALFTRAEAKRVARQLRAGGHTVSAISDYGLTSEARVWPPIRIPPCAASMGCLCAGHARGNDADAACDTTE